MKLLPALWFALHSVFTGGIRRPFLSEPRWSRDVACSLMVTGGVGDRSKATVARAGGPHEGGQSGVAAGEDAVWWMQVY
jgi:hypothetical protein